MILIGIKVTTAGKGDRGIYLREWEDTRKVIEVIKIYSLFSVNEYKVSVNVKTVFHTDTDNKVKVEFEQRISLQATQSWIQVPKFLQTANEGLLSIFLFSIFTNRTLLYCSC